MNLGQGFCEAQEGYVGLGLRCFWDSGERLLNDLV